MGMLRPRFATHRMIFAVAALGGCIQLDDSLDGATSTVIKTWPVGASPTVRIEAFNGGIWVRPGRDGEVRVVVSRNGSCKNLSQKVVEEALKFIEVDASAAGDAVTILSRERPGATVGCGLSTSIEVWVPVGASLNLATGIGSISVAGKPSRVRASNRGGVALFELDGTSSAAPGRAPPLMLEGWGGTVEIEGKQGIYSFAGAVKPKSISPAPGFIHKGDVASDEL